MDSHSVRPLRLEYFAAAWTLFPTRPLSSGIGGDATGSKHFDSPAAPVRDLLSLMTIQVYQGREEKANAIRNTSALGDVFYDQETFE